jgi:hypothetical protein
MARAVDIDEKVLDSLAEVFEAAWLVVGRRGHSLDQAEGILSIKKNSFAATSHPRSPDWLPAASPIAESSCVDQFFGSSTEADADMRRCLRWTKRAAWRRTSLSCGHC